MSKLDLAVCAREGERPCHRSPIVILLDELPGGILVLGEPGRKGQSSGAARRNSDRLSEADDRIEDRAGRVRERPGPDECEWPGERSTAANEACAVGLVFRRTVHAPAPAEHVDQVQAIRPGARSPDAYQRIPFGYSDRFHEQVAERRMRKVGVSWCQHDFGVARHVEAARAVAVIGQRHPAQLHIVFRRDDDLGPELDADVEAAKRGAVRGKADLVLVWLAAGRLERCRPYLPRVEIAHVDEAAPRVCRDVLAPSRHREVLPAAVSAARIGQHHRVRPVRQQVRARAQRVGRHVASKVEGRVPSRRRYVCRFLDWRVLERYQARDAFLEQQFGRLHTRIRVEAALHR